MKQYTIFWSRLKVETTIKVVMVLCDVLEKCPLFMGQKCGCFTTPLTVCLIRQNINQFVNLPIYAHVRVWAMPRDTFQGLHSLSK